MIINHLTQGQRLSYELQEDRPGKVSATNLQAAEQAASDSN